MSEHETLLPVSASAQSGANQSALIPLETDGGRSPLFIVEGLGGDAKHFRGLSGQLQGDYPVYVVALPSGPVQDPKAINIVKLASKYVGDIRSAFPSGPYHLAGYSIGGLIALEMARQLSAIGEEVAFLALIECERNAAGSVQHSPSYRPSSRLALRLAKEKLKAVLGGGLLQMIGRRMEHIQLKRRLALAQRALRSGDSNHVFHAKELLVIAGTEYQVEPYSGDVALFVAKDELRSDLARDLGWSDVIRGQLDVVQVPGKHVSILFEPHVKSLADEMRTRMCNAGTHPHSPA